MKAVLDVHNHIGNHFVLYMFANPVLGRMIQDGSVLTDHITVAGRKLTDFNVRNQSAKRSTVHRKIGGQFFDCVNSLSGLHGDINHIILNDIRSNHHLLGDKNAPHNSCYDDDGCDYNRYRFTA